MSILGRWWRQGWKTTRRTERLRQAIEEYAADPAAHANHVIRLVGSSASRMRVGDFRVIFVETQVELSVVRVGPRGGVYDEGT